MYSNTCYYRRQSRDVKSLVEMVDVLKRENVLGKSEYDSLWNRVK